MRYIKPVIKLLFFILSTPFMDEYVLNTFAKKIRYDKG